MTISNPARTEDAQVTISSPNSEPPADLSNPAVRERLSPNAIRAFFRIMHRWKVQDDDARLLLGSNTSQTFQSLKKGNGQTLSEERLHRISFLLGIFEALNILYSQELADKWMQLPNTNNIFQGKTPIEHLKRGGLPAFAEVRKLLDARRWGF